MGVPADEDTALQERNPRESGGLEAVLGQTVRVLVQLRGLSCCGSPRDGRHRRADVGCDQVPGPELGAVPVRLTRSPLYKAFGLKDSLDGLPHSDEAVGRMDVHPLRAATWSRPWAAVQELPEEEMALAPGSEAINRSRETSEEAEENAEPQRCSCWSPMVTGLSVCTAVLALSLLGLFVVLRPGMSGPHAEEPGMNAARTGGGSQRFVDRLQLEAAARAANEVATGQCNFLFPGGAARCFCQLAGNAGCAAQNCTCPQGCNNLASGTNRTVTFKNLAKAGECSQTTALLTIPRSYFAHIDYLAQWCPAGMRSILVEMLESGFKSYQDQIAHSPVKQCVHGASLISQAWLHIHTFCPDGIMDGMSTTTHKSWCGTANISSDAERMADEIISWNLKDKELQQPRLNSCRTMGCLRAAPRPLCSCATECEEATPPTCCADYEKRCRVEDA